MTELLAVAGIYLIAGFVFAIAFAIRGCVALDAGANGSGVLFRLMLLPAATFLWPTLLFRWVRGANA